MHKTTEKQRVLARMLAEELKKTRGGSDPVYPTDTPRLDITDANNGDKPPV
jgi:hypothetical protein